MKPYLQIIWRVRFRAFGITFGTISDHKAIAIPDGLPYQTWYSYNDHGIMVSVATVTA